jgi:hypothetical protein
MTDIERYGTLHSLLVKPIHFSNNSVQIAGENVVEEDVWTQVKDHRKDVKNCTMTTTITRIRANISRRMGLPGYVARMDDMRIL